MDDDLYDFFDDFQNGIDDIGDWGGGSGGGAGGGAGVGTPKATLVTVTSTRTITSGVVSTTQVTVTVPASKPPVPVPSPRPLDPPPKLNPDTTATRCDTPGEFAAFTDDVIDAVDNFCNQLYPKVLGGPIRLAPENKIHIGFRDAYRRTGGLKFHVWLKYYSNNGCSVADDDGSFDTCKSLFHNAMYDCYNRRDRNFVMPATAWNNCVVATMSFPYNYYTTDPCHHASANKVYNCFKINGRLDLDYNISYES